MIIAFRSPGEGNTLFCRKRVYDKLDIDYGVLKMCVLSI
jgi:hypothetical protein